MLCHQSQQLLRLLAAGLDRDSAEPLYRQLADLLAAAMSTGELTGRAAPPQRTRADGAAAVSGVSRCVRQLNC